MSSLSIRLENQPELLEEVLKQFPHYHGEPLVNPGVDKWGRVWYRTPKDCDMLLAMTAGELSDWGDDMLYPISIKKFVKLNYRSIIRVLRKINRKKRE